MEVEEIQSQGHKFRRIIGNGEGRIEPGKKGDELHNKEEKQEEEEDGGAGEAKRRVINNNNNRLVVGGGGGGFDFSSGGGRLCGWPASRIVRVSRASGGKDRHSKVLTSKGLRDRRVRLSVNTAIQFYDLQDRLGFEQPSKAVEWLLKAAASSIAELPPISTTFPDNNIITTPTTTTTTTTKQLQQQLSDERSLEVDMEMEMEMEMGMGMEMDTHCLTRQQQQPPGALPKSACSSNSETSKGSVLSLSRSESRIKARERARERAKAAEKEKDKEGEAAATTTTTTTTTDLVFNPEHQMGQNLNHSLSQNAATFTELLTSGINGGGGCGGGCHNNSNSATSPNGSVGEANFFHKSPTHYSTPMDYFTPVGLLGPSRSHGFSSQLHLGNHPLVSSPLFSFAGEQHHQHHHHSHQHQHHQEMQHFSFLQDHFIPVVAAGNNGGGGGGNNNNGGGGGGGGGNEYNLNFTISSSSSTSPGLAGFSRGTLQSKSSTPSLLPHIPRFASVDGSQPTFFIGAAAAAANNAVESHQSLIPGFDARLQLCYGDGSGGARHSDHQKGKGKS